jgi:hypothetical protein
MRCRANPGVRNAADVGHHAKEVVPQRQRSMCMMRLVNSLSLEAARDGGRRMNTTPRGPQAPASRRRPETSRIGTVIGGGSKPPILHRAARGGRLSRTRIVRRRSRSGQHPSLFAAARGSCGTSRRYSGPSNAARRGSKTRSAGFPPAWSTRCQAAMAPRRARVPLATNCLVETGNVIRISRVAS